MTGKARNAVAVSRYEYPMRFPTNGLTWTNDAKRLVVSDASCRNLACSSCVL